MKKLKYMMMTVVCTLLASCMADTDSFDKPDLSTSPYGNNSLTETNVLTIAQLKERYANTIGSDGMEQVTDDIQIKGVVTGNDIEGNIYNEVSIEDGTGAFIICIAQGGLYGYLPVGQEILVSLKDLWIGAYGGQGEVGTPYTSASGSTYVSRMSRMLWNDHFKLIGKPNPNSDLVKPFEFDKTQLTGNYADVEPYTAANCGRLMVLRDVELKDADGVKVFAPDDGSVTLTANCANREIKGYASARIVVRTSSYADFANTPMPTGLVDITGIFTRYRNTWQILLRSVNDIQPAAGFVPVVNNNQP